jgi:hypothetical protein
MHGRDKDPLFFCFRVHFSSNNKAPESRIFFYLPRNFPLYIENYSRQLEFTSMRFASPYSQFATRKVLLVGSGPRAAMTLRQLVDVAAHVRWHSHNLDVLDVAEEIWTTGPPGQIEISFREPRALDFEEATAVIATLGEPLARRLSEQARASGCPVSVVGRPDLSTLYLDTDDEPDFGEGDANKQQRASLWQRTRTWLSSLLRVNNIQPRCASGTLEMARVQSPPSLRPRRQPTVRA